MSKKYGFFKNGKLVDSVYAESQESAVTNAQWDECFEIIDSNVLSGGTMDASILTATGTKEFPIFNTRD